MNPSSKGDSEGRCFARAPSSRCTTRSSLPTPTAWPVTSVWKSTTRKGPQTGDAVLNGVSKASGNLIACTEPVKTNRDGLDVRAWLAGDQGTNNANSNNVVVDDLPMSMLLDGGVGARGYRTLDLIQDMSGDAVFNQSADLFDVSELGGIFRTPTYLGGANAEDDWLAGWAVGLDAPLTP